MEISPDPMKSLPRANNDCFNQSDNSNPLDQTTNWMDNKYVILKPDSYGSGAGYPKPDPFNLWKTLVLVTEYLITSI